MKTSEAGIKLIEQFEGCKLTAYQDQNGVWTIGIGHAHDVHMGQFETQAQAEADLCTDVATAEKAVNSLVKVALTQHQFDALVSFTYNEGSSRLASSTILKRLNAGDYTGAKEAFAMWNVIGGHVSAGLVRRRDAEMALFATV
jgi:GH24 family phage-related lysozyme (muramidase)